MNSACSQYLDELQVNKETYPKEFSVNPKILSRESVLRINFPKDRPSNLAIQSPEGNWYIVHSQEEKIYVVPYERFSVDAYIDIPISSTKGLIWEDGKKKEQLVFQNLGEYTLYIVDNLETELENTFHFMEKIVLQK